MARFIVTADWDNNAPHLTEQARKDLWDGIPAYQRDARTKGIPQLGAGVIYPIAEEDITVEDFPIPDHWFRGYTLDVGWNRTCVLWRAKNPDTRVSYFYDEYYRSEETPTIVASAIRRRGLWIPGKVDPAARGRKQDDGEKMIKLYRREIYGDDTPEHVTLGTQMLTTATNAVEAGIYDVLMAYQTGMLKVFKRACPNLLAERRLYRRDEKGRIIKKNDHAMDAKRYSVASGDAWLKQKPAPPVEDPVARFGSGGHGRSPLGWMGT